MRDLIPEGAAVAPLGGARSPWATLWLHLRAALAGVKIQRRQRRLRLCETLSLGDKRLIALVEYENQRFLLAATPQRISLLQSLGPATDENPAPNPR
jgi:flagellar biogenesis protein FliO